MDRHERLRLLYVAATRARDHLIVSVHRKDSTTRGRPRPTCSSDGVGPGTGRAARRGRSRSTTGGGAAGATARAGAAFARGWEQQRDAARLGHPARRGVRDPARRGSSPGGQLEALAGVQKDPRDIDLPPWQKGRYGSAIGRAVHAVLQTVDLAPATGWREPAPPRPPPRGSRPGGRDRGVLPVGARVRRRPPAAGRPHWREVYVGIPYGDGVLEGYIDLLYRDDDGLVVVDYKTDSWRNEADLTAKAERYRVQLQAYGEAVAGSVGEPALASSSSSSLPTGAPDPSPCRSSG